MLSAQGIYPRPGIYIVNTLGTAFDSSVKLSKLALYTIYRTLLSLNYKIIIKSGLFSQLRRFDIDSFKPSGCQHDILHAPTEFLHNKQINRQNSGALSERIYGKACHFTQASMENKLLNS